MVRAKHEHKQLVVDILSKSFEKNMSVNFVVNGDTDKIPKLIAYCFDVGIEQGAVFVSDDQNAAAIILFPEKKNTTIKSIIRDMSLAFNVISIGRVLTVMRREKLIKSKQPQSPFIHLWYIGVYPEKTRKGVGSNLLNEVIQFCDTQAKDIYLETSNERNINFYLKHGFVHFDSIKEGLPYDLMLFMRNKLDVL
ncbi:acetyltransferase (GNAT) family protein [Flavobacteriaceae bacterium MAR_2009_75]|nr:acetyltransferase (GNAT) family protein [Flavobacteriaceae bacterium MAR_2009_75]